MQSNLSLQKRVDNSIKKEGVVLSISSFLKEKSYQEEKSSIMKTEKKIPLFYTEPIFKAKEHDLL